MTPIVSIIMGSTSDMPVMEAAAKYLNDMQIPFEINALSAHRTPELVAEFAKNAASKGIKVIIAAAGGAAHLPGVIAASTVLPVIGVPIKTTMGMEAWDSMLSIIQMPPGIPVATVGVNAAQNAAILATQILAVADPEIREKVAAKKASLADKITKANEELKKEEGEIRLQDQLMLTHDLAIGYAKPLISNINLTLQKRSMTCLVGANGTGKTTFLRTLAGLQRPLSGVVEVDGKAISTLSPAQISRLVSVVLTDKVADSLITVNELVAMGRMPYTGFLGRLSDGDQKIVADSIARLGIDNISDCRLQEISDGQRQRAFIARALAQQTPIIILDEPTAFLDFRSRAEVMELLQHLAHDDGKSVLLSTHELDLAERFGDWYWVMEKGRIMEAGALQGFYN